MEVIDDESLIDKIFEDPKYLDRNNIVRAIYVSTYSLNNRDDLYIKFEKRCSEKIVDYTLSKLIDKEMLFEEDGKLLHKK